MSKPYIICHMAASIDGRIDCDMTEKMGIDDIYKDTEGDVIYDLKGNKVNQFNLSTGIYVINGKKIFVN